MATQGGMPFRLWLKIKLQEGSQLSGTAGLLSGVAWLLMRNQEWGYKVALFSVAAWAVCAGFFYLSTKLKPREVEWVVRGRTRTWR